MIYAGTGDNFSDPPTNTNDAILAFDMQTGKIAWAKQLTAGDAYTVGCRMNNRAGCPDSNGPDFDIGAPPILVKLAGGRRVLLVSQKSGIPTRSTPTGMARFYGNTALGVAVRWEAFSGDRLRTA